MKLLIALFVAAALPARVWIPLGPFRSFSYLDLVIVWCLFSLLTRLMNNKRFVIGDPWILLYLSIPFGLSQLSFNWTESPTETFRAVSVYLEALIAYLTVTVYLDGRTQAEMFRIANIFILTTLTACVLMLLGVPGFAPQLIGNPTADDYIAYFVRLSHPFLGRSNNLAGILAIFIFPYATYAWSRKSPFLKAMTVLIALALLLTMSRGVLLAVALIAFMMMLTSSAAFARLLIWTGMTGPIVAAATTWVLTAVPIAAQYIGDRFTTKNIDARSGIMDAAIYRIAERPLLGYGAGAIGLVDGRLREGAHNTYLEQILAFGMPLGILCSLSLIMIAVRLRKIANNTGDKAMTGAWLAPACQLLIVMTEAAFEGSILRIIYYMTIAWIVSLLRASPQTRS